MVPLIAFERIYSFDVDSLVNAIPHPESISAEQFGPTAEELFNRIMLIADNAGATDEHRAINVPGRSLSGHLCKHRRSARE
jgi:hypothetical protein